MTETSVSPVNLKNVLFKTDLPKVRNFKTFYLLAKRRNSDYLQASPAVLKYLIRRKYISHPSLVMYSFATPTHKTETGTAYKWGTTNNKPPGPIIMMGQSETGSSN
jgi:hypothetical protein